jgi:hypothetical protein
MRIARITYMPDGSRDLPLGLTVSVPNDWDDDAIYDAVTAMPGVGTVIAVATTVDLAPDALTVIN